MAERTHEHKDLVAKPEPFDGKTENYESFRRQVTLYFAAYPTHFPTASSKILFTLSYFKSGLADQWAQNYIDENTSEEGEITLAQTWLEFIRSLNTTFGDQNKVQNALAKLNGLRQGTKTAEEFFQLFDQYKRAAGYATGHDAHLIDLLEHQLKPSIVRTMYTGENLPTTYEGWRTKAIRIDGLDRRFRGLGLGNTDIRVPAKLPPAPRQENESQRTGTGVTFGGRGQAMDVDERRRKGLCFRCGQAGHISRNCPGRRTQQARAIAQGWTEEERKEMLAVLQGSKTETKKEENTPGFV